MATKLIWRRVKPWGVQVGRTLNVHERHRSESQPDRLPIEARRFCWVQSRPRPSGSFCSAETGSIGNE
jgi:hypothetical protein